MVPRGKFKSLLRNYANLNYAYQNIFFFMGQKMNNAFIM